MAHLLLPSFLFSISLVWSDGVWVSSVRSVSCSRHTDNVPQYSTACPQHKHNSRRILINTNYHPGGLPNTHSLETFHLMCKTKQDWPLQYSVIIIDVTGLTGQFIVLLASFLHIPSLPSNKQLTPYERALKSYNYNKWRNS